MATAIGLAEDRQKGLFERFRALPLASSAVLAGRIVSDVIRNVFVAMLCLVGLTVDFRVHGEVLGVLGGLLLLLAFGGALSTMFASVGLMVPNAESAQAAAFPLLAPLVFASSALVSVSAMPGWLGSSTCTSGAVVID